jgi:hypothetical protein
LLNNGSLSAGQPLAATRRYIAGSDNGVAGIDRMTFESTATSVPEPATLGLLLAGLAGGLIARRARAKI